MVFIYFTFIVEPAVQILITVEKVTPLVTENVKESTVTKEVDVVDSVAPAEKAPVAGAIPENIVTDTESAPELGAKSSTSTTETKIEEIKSDFRTTEAPKEVQDKMEVTSQTETDTVKETNKPAPKTRKRAKSTSSNKSVTDLKPDAADEPKTPVTRKRTQSNASNKSTAEEQKTPENAAVEESTTTPSRRRVKTPSSTEVRKIITRRASKEMSEKLDESKEILDDSVTATPRRRSTRSRAKNIDDNESVASEGSVRSVRSKASEDAGDVKAGPVRKGRKSVLSTKPDLSVIPENIVEEESKGSEEIISDYSSSRR